MVHRGKWRALLYREQIEVPKSAAVHHHAADTPVPATTATTPMPIDPDFAAALAAHCAQAPGSVRLEEGEVAEQIEAYVRLVWKWNEQLNLTRHTTWERFVSRDLRDCLHLAPLIAPGEEVLDLGSGNGIPGIPLALLRPDISVSLAESVGKRAKVLDAIIAELGLPVPVYAARGEHLLEDFRFTTIVSRAVGSLAKFCRWIEPNWANVDRLLLIKGPRWVAERGEARHLGVLQGLNLRCLSTYPLGDEDGSEGVILQISPKDRELPHIGGGPESLS